jgi:hypothetical protein
MIAAEWKKEMEKKSNSKSNLSVSFFCFQSNFPLFPRLFDVSLLLQKTNFWEDKMMTIVKKAKIAFHRNKESSSIFAFYVLRWYSLTQYLGVIHVLTFCVFIYFCKFNFMQIFDSS